MGLLDVLRGNNITPEMAKAKPGLFHLLNRDTGNNLQDFGATLSALAWGGHPEDLTRISANRTDRNRYQIEQDAADRTAKAWSAKVAAAENYAKKIELSNPDLAAALRANPDNLDVLTKSNLDLRNANSSTDHRLGGEQKNWLDQNVITDKQSKDNEHIRTADETAKELAVTAARLKGEQSNWKDQNAVTSDQAIKLSQATQQAETDRALAVKQFEINNDPLKQFAQSLRNAGSESSSASGPVGGGAPPSSPTVGAPLSQSPSINPEVLAKLQSQLGQPSAQTPTPAPTAGAPPSPASTDEHSVAAVSRILASPVVRFGIPNILPIATLCSSVEAGLVGAPAVGAGGGVCAEGCPS